MQIKLQTFRKTEFALSLLIMSTRSEHWCNERVCCVDVNLIKDKKAGRSGKIQPTVDSLLVINKTQTLP